VSQYLKSNVQFHLAEKLSRAIGDYLDGTGDYPVDVKYMPLAEYIVDEVLDGWVCDWTAAAIDLERKEAGG
jgi:hypothetical protein